LPVDQQAQAAIGGGNDADVDAVGAVAADPLDGEILDGAQQLSLGGEPTPSYSAFARQRPVEDRSIGDFRWICRRIILDPVDGAGRDDGRFETSTAGSGPMANVAKTRPR
jgi:hypothetical protein